MVAGHQLPGEFNIHCMLALSQHLPFRPWDGSSAQVTGCESRVNGICCHAGRMIGWSARWLAGSLRQALWQTEACLAQETYWSDVGDGKSVLFPGSGCWKWETLLDLSLPWKGFDQHVSALRNTLYLFWRKKRRGTMWEVCQDDHANSLLSCSHVVNKDYWRLLEWNVLASTSRIPRLARLQVCLPAITTIDCFQ